MRGPEICFSQILLSDFDIMSGLGDPTDGDNLINLLAALKDPRF